MFGSVGFPEIMMIFLVVMLLFGPKKLPDFAKTLAKTLKEFRKTFNEAKTTLKDGFEEELKELENDVKKQTDFSNTMEEFMEDDTRKEE